MANKKTDPEQESQVDNKTLLENIEGLEREKTMLKEQKERAEQEKKQISEQLEQSIKERLSLGEKITKLEAEKAQLQETIDNNASPAPEGSEDIEALKAQIETLTRERDKAVEEAGKQAAACKKANEEYNSSKQQLEALQSEEKGIVLEPFIKDYLELLAQKLSKKFKKEVTPAQIVSDYIIRYNLTERWTEWFHPWVMTEEDAITVMKKYVPEITSFKQVKKALKIS